MEGNLCAKHSLMLIKMVCFDNNCNNREINCLNCFMLDHTTCDKRYIVQESDIKNRVKINNFTSDTEWIEKFNADFKILVDKMVAEIYEYKDKMLSSLSKASDVADLLNPNNKDLLKHSFITTFDQSKSIIELSPKEGVGEDMSKNVEVFLEKMSKKLKNYVKDFTSLSLFEMEKPKEEDWEVVNEIQKEVHNKEIAFTRVEDYKEDIAQTCYLKTPLLVGDSFKVTINNIASENRFLGLGIMNELALKSKQSSGLVIPKPDKKHLKMWYGGSAHSNNLKGRLSTHSDKSKTAFKSGFTFFLDYKVDQQIRIYDSDGNLDLTGNLKDYNEPLFLYAKLTSKGDCISIEKR